MIDPKKIELIARQIHEFIPKSINDFGNNIEKKIYQILQTQLIRLNLVSREEFDVQTKMLSHVREKLISLEQRLTKLEDNVSVIETKSESTSTPIDDHSS